VPHLVLPNLDHTTVQTPPGALAIALVGHAILGGAKLPPCRAAATSIRTRS
jgi:hypothetical protein